MKNEVPECHFYILVIVIQNNDARVLGMTEWIFSTLFLADDHIANSLLIHIMIFVFIDLLIIGECKRHR